MYSPISTSYITMGITYKNFLLLRPRRTMDKKAPWKDRPRIYEDIFFEGLGFLAISPQTGFHHCCGPGTALRVFITNIPSTWYISWPERRQVTCLLAQRLLDPEKSDLDLKEWSGHHLELLDFETDTVVRWNVGFSPLISMHVLCKGGWWPKGLTDKDC